MSNKLPIPTMVHQMDLKWILKHYVHDFSLDYFWHLLDNILSWRNCKVSLNLSLINSKNGHPCEVTSNYKAPYSMPHFHIRIKAVKRVMNIHEKSKVLDSNINGTLLEQFNSSRLIISVKNQTCSSSIIVSFDDYCQKWSKHHQSLECISPHNCFNSSLNQ